MCQCGCPTAVEKNPVSRTDLMHYKFYLLSFNPQVSSRVVSTLE